jgi:hypothetical protein
MAVTDHLSNSLLGKDNASWRTSTSDSSSECVAIVAVGSGIHTVSALLMLLQHQWQLVQHACCAQKHNITAGGSCSQVDHAMLQGTLVGNKVYLFGGEDAARRPQGDLFVLDLADMEWQSPDVTGKYSNDSHQAAVLWSRQS